MKNTLVILLLTTFALLAGCSTMSKTECLATDWQQVGLTDAQNGIGTPDNSSMLEGCSKHDVEVDMAAYNKGQEEGITLFCQTDNAFELGKKGHEYSVACPTKFNDEYNIGYQYYVGLSNVRTIEQALSNTASRITSLESRISQSTVQLNSDDDLSHAEETSLRQSIESMDGQLTTHELNIERLEVGLTEARQQLQTIKDHYGR